ncbi:aldehyde dehydrogenase family protein [Paraburkholderia xenovorans]|uniref:hypothetical protein n=1 Tax=Paraburkholderia xenovorans TaxID=36873 RepID=UPI0007C645F4|nr:hypothetical protein [Paraburkholderia xenovorans]
MTSTWKVPLIIRGNVIESDEQHFGGRRGGVSFTAPDVRRHADELTLRGPSMMADLYTLSLDEIVDFLVELGQHLNFRRQSTCSMHSNWRARPRASPKASCAFTTRARRDCSSATSFMPSSRVRWAPITWRLGRAPGKLIPASRHAPARSARAFVHVIAGNAPVVAVLTVIRQCADTFGPRSSRRPRTTR